MRILFVTTEFPFPTNSGGRVRTLAELRLLASLPEVKEIAVFSLREDPEDLAAARKLKEENPKFRIAASVFHPIHLKQFPRYVPRVIALRAAGVPYLAGKWDGPKVRAALTRELQSQRFDVVYIDHLGMYRYADLIRKLQPWARLVLEQHNVESDFFHQFKDKKQGALKLVAHLEWQKARRFEQAAVRTADATVAISVQDAQVFRDMGGGDRIHAIAQVVDAQRGEYAPATPAEVLYVGNLGWHPNVAGLDWFFGRALPAMRKVAPDVKITIVGSGLKKDSSGRHIVPDRWQRPNVSVVGFVEDLAPLYARSSVVIAPVLGGSGVRIKLLEAMKVGVPVVTTRDGAEGLPLKHDRDLLIAQDPDSFGRMVADLAQSREKQLALREGAFQYLETHHGTSHAQRQMRRALGMAVVQTSPAT
jgi:polysaccharide biosynthesis protein PslH